MGFFDKLKKKVSESIKKASDALDQAAESIESFAEPTLDDASIKIEKTTAEAIEAVNYENLKQGLEKTRKSFVATLQTVFGAGRKIDEELLEDVEEALLTADVGVDLTERIIDNLRERVRQEGYEDAIEVYDLLKEEIYNVLIESPSAENDAIYEIEQAEKPYVILVIGVNGVGKTTTIGKLAYNYRLNGKSVIIGAADTFRAAANEQLEIWANRAGVGMVSQSKGADPSAVVFDAIKSAQSKNADVVLIDTAGRLHNKANLMKELEKMNRVIKKLKPGAPDEVYLVLDATTGQNALVQAKEFMKTADITGLILTKLDGTAKGGVIIPIAAELKIPVRYIGVGEKIHNLQVFDPNKFIVALFDDGSDDEEEATAKTLSSEGE